MDCPKSLTRTRSWSLLPKLIKKGRKNILDWPKMSREEAEYILHLDSMYTYSEVSSFMLGTTELVYGMQLVTVAEKSLS